MRVAVIAALVICVGCKNPGRGGSAGGQAPASAPRALPQVPALELVDQPMEVVLQEIADASEPEVQLLACGDLLERRVTLRTNERKSVAVVMAMLVTQLRAPATVEGHRWTIFCRDAAAGGKLFQKGRPTNDVTVPKAPEGPK